MIKTILPWLVTVASAWSLGYIYNVYGGGELSWLLRMYDAKAALAEEIKAPRRLIVAAGSGAHYSVDSGLMSQELGIPVFNFGLQGDLGLNVICPLILKEARKGDIILLIPEYLLLTDDDGIGYGDGLFGSIPFSIAKGDPLLPGASFDKIAEEAWLMGVPTLKAVVKSSLDLAQKGRMTGYLSDPIQKNGDPTKVKERTGEWWKLPVKQPISRHSLMKIDRFRKDLAAKGATLIVSLPWIYGSHDPETLANIRKSGELLSMVVPTIYNKDTLNIHDDPSIFADTHYHLLPQGRLVRSQELVQQLRPIISATKNQPY
ncbi:MAG: hypothetical protein N5P05_002443 [Chroococcopsis gigantea SAG 12.99]|jgi:hypothetical protein|nr:hypothetical protein [Chroococcopsis gigantea SAG 12.99]